VFAANTRQQNRARAAVTSLGPDAATGVIDIRRAERLAREHRNSQLAGIPSDPLPAGVRIDHCDFRELDIADASVDLILTDPPYTTASMDVWDDLGRLAARWLKPGAFLVAVSGQANLPRALDALTAAGLDYWWSMAMLHGSGEVTQVRGRHLGSRFKLILVMRAPGGQTRPPWFVDTLNPSAKEKDLHPWQQSVAHFEYLVEHLSSPGDLVVDPFLGSGTTALAAQRHGRTFIGSELDEATVGVARNRCAIRAESS
jgi:site-specific DNA-methyltransferase (adenine-specific)